MYISIDKLYRQFGISVLSKKNVRTCVCVCSNVVDLSAVTAGAGVDAAAAAPSQVSHDAVSTTPIYERCGPPTSSSAAVAERPVPRPRSTYGKYYLENLKNINAESKPASDSRPANDDHHDDDDDDDDDAFCQ